LENNGDKKDDADINDEGDHIQWLTHGIMKQHTFKTMTDNEDIYCYDNERGVYAADQEWRIKELSQLMYPGITTHALHEVINQIKRRTYVERSSFDSNIDILNLQNGLLNIHTLKYPLHEQPQTNRIHKYRSSVFLAGFGLCTCF
jgi:hypothetical protein